MRLVLDVPDDFVFPQCVLTERETALAIGVGVHAIVAVRNARKGADNDARASHEAVVTEAVSYALQRMEIDAAAAHHSVPRKMTQQQFFDLRCSFH